MSRRLLVPNELPEWFVNASPNALFRPKDVAILFGFTSGASLGQSVLYGSFPKPLKTRGFYSRHSFWTKAVIQEEFERRRAENSRIEEDYPK